MSLGFSIHTKSKKLETFRQVLDKLAAESGCQTTHNESSSSVVFCKLGTLSFCYEAEENEANKEFEISGECQTNLLGAGFHKAAIEFIDRLQAVTAMPIEVEDDTDYYLDRDFENLKNNHFYKWLAEVFKIMQEQEAQGSIAFSLCWDIYNYIPQSAAGVVVSPFGPFRLSDVTARIEQEGIASFACDFFLWDNPEPDARLYRGLALHSLWEECYFMPSARSDADAGINGYIIAMLEKAARLDPSLPFPKKEYEEVCRLHGCPPIPTDGMPEYVCGFPIGYRREKVDYKVGKFSFTVPGSYLKETEGNTLILYDGDDETWHTIRCTAFSTEGTPDFPDMEEERIAEGEITGGRFRLYDIGYSSDSDTEDDKPYPNYSCHVAGDGQFTLLTLCASDPDELKMLAKGVVSGMKLQEQPDINEKKILYYNETNMEELKKQIAAWHESDDHQAIVDALEKIPATERDCETTGLLARAYNNLENYAKAVELLESVKEEGESDHSWNFRMGYALYFMNRNKEAIGYFKKAQELNPEDEDAPEFIRYCNTEMPFRKRVEDFWEWFLANEAKLSEMVHARDENEADNFVEFIGQGANLISEDVHFNMGGDHEFTFSVEGWPDLFFLYSYVVSRMPDSLKGKWKFFPFNPGKQEPFRFKMYDTDVDMMDVQVAASYQEETNDFILTYYEKNLCALPEDKSWNVFYIMAEIMLGEGVTFQYIKTVEKAEKPQAGMIALPELRKHIEETLQAHDKKFIENPKDVYTTYKFAPKEAEEELPLRYDVVIGSTCLNSLVAEYYQNTTELFDHINSFGAQAVYLNFPHHNGKDEDASSVLNFRHDLEDRINDEILVPEGLGQLLGGATGTESSYIDLLVFDFNRFAEKVRVLLQEYPQYSFYLSDFRQNCRLFRLTEGEAEEEADNDDE